MPSLFWAVLAGTALLGGAVIVHLLSGRELARTRANLLDAMRLFENRERAFKRMAATQQFAPAGSSQTQDQQQSEVAYQATLGRERRSE